MGPSPCFSCFWSPFPPQPTPTHLPSLSCCPGLPRAVASQLVGSSKGLDPLGEGSQKVVLGLCCFHPALVWRGLSFGGVREEGTPPTHSPPTPLEPAPGQSQASPCGMPGSPQGATSPPIPSPWSCGWVLRAPGAAGAPCPAPTGAGSILLFLVFYLMWPPPAPRGCTRRGGPQSEANPLWSPCSPIARAWCPVRAVLLPPPPVVFPFHPPVDFGFFCLFLFLFSSVTV